MTLKSVVKKGHVECPNCHTHFEVTSKVNGEGSKPQGDTHLRKITEGIKLEIICAYLQSPYNPTTTREIIDRINNHRGINNKLERSNLTRPHSELIDSGVILVQFKQGYDFYHTLNVDKAKKLLPGYVS